MIETDEAIEILISILILLVGLAAVLQIYGIDITAQITVLIEAVVKLAIFVIFFVAIFNAVSDAIG